MSDTAKLDDGRDVADLKVVELREELQKRGLSKTGNKKELADRLRNFIVEGTAEVSEKSASNSPVKSPVNSLIAQYRSTQQQLLKDVHKDEESSADVKEDAKEENENNEVIENGHKETERTVKPDEKSEQHEKTSEKEKTPEKEQSPKLEAKKVPPAKTESSPEKVEIPIPQPSNASPKHRERSESPEREVTPIASEPLKEEKPIVSKTESPKNDTIDRAISEEPGDDEDDRDPTPPREKSVQQVSGVESDTSKSPTPKSRSPSEEKTSKQENGDKKLQEPGEELDYEDEKPAEATDANKKKSEVYTEGIVYVKDEAEKPKPKRSIASQKDDEDRTPEGFLRRVTVSPPRNSKTNYVYIRGLKRPFTPLQWFNVLQKFGTFDKEADHWMDGIKSQSIVRFATVEEAEKAREGLHHVLWPEGNGTELLVDFTDEEEFIERKGIIRKIIKNDDMEEVKAKSPSPMEDDLPSPKEVTKRDRDYDRDEGPSNKKRKAEPKALEDLFRKTTTDPAIYYLPLNDEEAARRQAQKAIEKRENQEGKVESPSLRRRERSPRKSSPPLRKRSPSPRPSPPRKRDRRSPSLKRDAGTPPKKSRRSPSPRRERGGKSTRRSPPSVRRSSPSRPKSPPLKRAASPASKRPPSSPPSRRRSPSPRRR